MDHGGAGQPGSSGEVADRSDEGRRMATGRVRDTQRQAIGARQRGAASPWVRCGWLAQGGGKMVQAVVFGGRDKI